MNLSEDLSQPKLGFKASTIKVEIAGTNPDGSKATLLLDYAVDDGLGVNLSMNRLGPFVTNGDGKIEYKDKRSILVLTALTKPKE